MSAMRTNLLAAAVLGGVLAPTTHCWAQAYGARAVVEHNDLRWFEPIDLDIDGQMPHRDSGFFGSFDKLYWATINPRVVIGQEGLTVNSEQPLQNPNPEVGLLAVDQVLGFQFIQDIADETNRLEAAVSFSGIQFVNPNGTPYQLTTQAALENDVRNNGVAVAGAPAGYQVQNGIRDALPDAGFAWGERIEFGYSDGEQGWMVTILDGPEAQAGGTWGAGEFSPYTSQSGDDTGGTDPAFNSDLDDDDGDGVLDGDGELDAVDLFALGFGSVAVNFNLPNPDFLTGFRDYNNGDTPFTTTGPVTYVGNTGTEFTDLNIIGIDFGSGTAADPLNTNDATDATAAITAELATDMFATDVQASTSSVQSSLDAIESQLLALGEIDPTDAVQNNLELAIESTQTAINALQGSVNTASGNAVGNVIQAVDKPPINDDILVVNNELSALDTLLATVDTGADGGGTGQDLQVDEEDRLADDLNGNGAQGFRLVRADIDNDGVIDDDEVVALILDFGDLYEFNVFFDDVTVRNVTEIDGVELMRMHELSTRHKLQQGRWDNLRLSYGVRFLSVKDDFFFLGRGSILGRTSVSTEVENQIVGPQLGLKWTRKDGPWDFILEARGTVGYNIADVDQDGIFGEELIPGALNRPANGRATTSVDGQRYDEFSPLAELRAQLKYRLADSISLQAGYTAKYVGNIHRGGQATAWNAPDFGIDDSTSDLFTNGLNFGVEIRH